MAIRTYTYTDATFALLNAESTMIGGDVGYTSDYGYHWRYDGASSLWRIQGRFSATFAQMQLMTATNLAGCQPGDLGWATDTEQLGVYLGGTGVGAWSFLT